MAAVVVVVVMVGQPQGGPWSEEKEEDGSTLLPLPLPPHLGNSPSKPRNPCVLCLCNAGMRRVGR